MPVAGVYTLTVADLAGLTLHAPDSDLFFKAVDGQPHSHVAGIPTCSPPHSITVSVTPVADAPVLAAADAVAVSSSVNEDGTVALTITPHFESEIGRASCRESFDMTVAAGL